MSFIRSSTKVPGQKNLSRTFAHWDCHGGVIIDSRKWRDPDQPETHEDVSVRLSLPEMLYMCRQFMHQMRGFAKDEGLTLAEFVARKHRGFYQTYDAEHEKWRRKARRQP